MSNSEATRSLSIYEGHSKSS